jgi:hypothetical protein
VPFTFTFPFFFDPAQSVLRAHQADNAYTPYVHLALTKSGFTSYDYYSTDRIISVDIHQDPFKDEGEIVLSNYDKALTDIDFRDYKAVLSFGLVISGTAYYEAQPPQWVNKQESGSEQGKLTITLKTIGMISKMRLEHASIEYTGGGNAKNMVDQILKATMTPFSHCEGYSVVWHGDTGLSGINLYSPSENFYVGLNVVRFNVVRALMDLSDSFMRVENDEKIHIRIPVTTGTDYANTFSLDGHVFFWHTRNDKLISPNHVHVESTVSEDRGYDGDGNKVPDLVYTYEGDAYDAASYALTPESYFVEAYGLASDAEAQAMAEGIMNNIIVSEFKGAFECPMDFFLKLGHYIKVEDARSSGQATIISSHNETENYTLDDTWVLGQSIVLVAQETIYNIKVKLSRQSSDANRKVTLRLYATVGGLPDGVPLATVEVDYDDVTVDGGLVTFEFASAQTLVAGTYFFTLTTSGGEPAATVTYFDGDPSVVGGNEFYGDLENNWTSYDNYDIYFEVTGLVADEHTGNVGSIDWHYSAGYFRQVVGLGGFLSGRKVSGFTQDYIPEEEAFNFPNWMTPSGCLNFKKSAEEENNHTSVFTFIWYNGLDSGSYETWEEVNISLDTNWPIARNLTSEAGGSGSDLITGAKIMKYYDGSFSNTARFGRGAFYINLAGYGYEFGDYVKSAKLKITVTPIGDDAVWARLGKIGVGNLPGDYSATWANLKDANSNIGEMDVNAVNNYEFDVVDFVDLDDEYFKFSVVDKIGETDTRPYYPNEPAPGETRWVGSYVTFSNISLELEVVKSAQLRNHVVGEDLHPDEWIVISIFVLPHYRTLYLGEYNVWGIDVNEDAAGKMIIVVWDSDAENWVTLFTGDANSYYKGDVIDLYDSYDAGGTPVAIIFYNDGETDIVDFNCFAAIDSRYQPGGNP